MVDLINLAGQVAILFVSLSILFRLLKGLWCLYLGNALGFGEQFKPRDARESYAVVTGSTDGIGLEYAKELLKRGYNLLLISRNHDKLVQVREELLNSNNNKCNKEIKTHAADFSRTDIYEAIEEQINALPRVDVLVNNVGMSYEHPEYFASDYLLEQNNQIMNVNSVSCARMCYIVLPRMEAQKYGVILNVSSFSAVNPAPLLSIYAGTKAFMDSFTRSISYEYEPRGITIQSVLPGFVMTKMSKLRKPTLTVPTATNYVTSQLRTVGLDRQTTGYWSHELQYYVAQRIFPVIWSSDLTVKFLFKEMVTFRTKALRRKERLLKQEQQASLLENAAA